MIRIFFIACAVLQQPCFAAYYSQNGQDQYVNENYFQNRKGGVFVEVGAYNGIMFSNTYFFEKELGWTGICIEPIPERFAELKQNRSCICIEGCISDKEGSFRLLKVLCPFQMTEMLTGLLDKYDPRHLDRVNFEMKIFAGSYRIIDVNCYTLNSILEKNGITHVDLLSIDTEGGEFDIISSIDFSRFEIDVICVEDNYNDPKFVLFLLEKGYAYVCRLGCDLLFVHKRIGL